NAGFSSADQYTLPVSGSTLLIPSGVQSTSCRVPPASMIDGGQYPGSLADSARQSPLTVSLSKATRTLPSPPTVTNSFCPSTSGWPANPHCGACTPYSFLRSFCHTTLPLAASRQRRSPIVPRV